MWAIDEMKINEYKESGVWLEKTDIMKSSWMDCPQCSGDLRLSTQMGITVTKCDACNGIFLDSKQFQNIAHQR